MKKLGTLIFNILVAEAKVHDGLRDQFLDWFSNPLGNEFRIGGVLGFGGKFWRNDEKMYVSCYTEDMKPKQKKVIDKINKLLEGV